MQSRHEALSFGNKDWVCVSVQSPLGAVMLARRIPLIPRRVVRVRSGVLNGASRQFGLSSQPGLAMKRARSRRQP